MSCHFMSCYFVLCSVLPCSCVVLCHVMSCHLMSCWFHVVISCYVMSCHVVSCYCVVSCHVICFLTVGGLAEEVNEKIINAAFIPFGDIIDIQIPLDYETGKSYIRNYIIL